MEFNFLISLVLFWFRLSDVWLHFYEWKWGEKGKRRRRNRKINRLFWLTNRLCIMWVIFLCYALFTFKACFIPFNFLSNHRLFHFFICFSHQTSQFAPTIRNKHWFKIFIFSFFVSVGDWVFLEVVKKTRFEYVLLTIDDLDQNTNKRRIRK